MQTLISNDIWKTLLKEWAQSPRFVAVAYFSKCDNMPFSPNDVLVVDASEKAVKSGQTNPTALLQVLESGAKIYSSPSLHAKVYVLSDQVYVGSANASASSRDNLIECMVSSDDPHLVSDSIRFVRSLAAAGKPLDQRRLEALKKLYVPPKPGGKPRPPLPQMRESRCWIVGIIDLPYPGDDGKLHQSMKEIENERDDAADEHLAWFWWPTSVNREFSKGAQEGDLIVEVYRTEKNRNNPGDVKVYRHARILDIEPHPEDKTIVYYCAWRKDYEKTCLSWEQFQSLAKQAGIKFKLSLDNCRSIPTVQSQRLTSLWPSK